MIPHLASATVCVIDDERPDYEPLLKALLQVGLGSVHVRGDAEDSLPAVPLAGVRIVFMDLHLNGTTGKSAASHAAKVFQRTVSSQTGPVVAVIWSKYAGDKPSDEPEEDQETEADLFKSTLLEAEPRFRENVVFVEMRKPKQGTEERSDNEQWIQALRADIDAALSQVKAFHVLWSWEALLRDGGSEVTAALAKLAGELAGVAGTQQASDRWNEQMQSLLRVLAQQQGGPDCVSSTSCRHLFAVLSQLVLDSLDTRPIPSNIIDHGTWLAEKVDPPLAKGSKQAARLNSHLLTSVASPTARPYLPGTVFVIDETMPEVEQCGLNIKKLREDCFEKKDKDTPAFANFKAVTKPVLIEITPLCDFHQGHCSAAMLVAGLACPKSEESRVQKKDACKATQVFSDRFEVLKGDWLIVVCSRHRLVVSPDVLAPWLKPWLRLRDGILSDFRSWCASQSARGGYLSF